MIDLARAPFSDVAAALERQANLLADRALEVETLALKIGLSRNAIHRSMLDCRRHAELVAQGCKIIRSLAPIEGTVRAVISAGDSW